MTTADTAFLHGRTLLRFAHAYASGGGTESYLHDLDRSLLARAEVHIIRLYLARQPDQQPVREQAVGRGRLTCIPLATVPSSPGANPRPDPAWREHLRDLFRRRVLRHPLIWERWIQPWNRNRELAVSPGQALHAGETVRQILRSQPVDLAIFHYVGGADAGEVLAATRAAGVPSIYLNHFANDRLEHLAIRKHLELMDGIAGVNGLDVPADLRPSFENLSDGIDLQFFRRSATTPAPEPSPLRPVLFLPGRITREKGQLDLLRALRTLVQRGVDCEVALAGRVDASAFPRELERFAARHHLSGRVRLLGNLNPVQLRDWYGRAAVTVLPTYHHEGLPRVLLESQAMETPVVAYATGGIPEGIQQGVTGFTVRTGDLTALTDHLDRLLRSTAKRQKLGAAARALTESRFSLNRLAERHESYYGRIIRRQPSRSRWQPTCGA